MTSSNRKATREALADLLETALVGAGKPVQEVLDYKKGDLGGKSPVVVVTSSDNPSRRYDYAMGSQKWRNVFTFDVLVFVADADDDETGSGWDEADVEDKLDDIEQAIAEVIATNQANANWTYITYGDQGTATVPVSDLGGNPYVVEIIPISVEVYDA